MYMSVMIWFPTSKPKEDTIYFSTMHCFKWDILYWWSCGALVVIARIQDWDELLPSPHMTTSTKYPIRSNALWKYTVSPHVQTYTEIIIIYLSLLEIVSLLLWHTDQLQLGDLAFHSDEGDNSCDSWDEEEDEEASMRQALQPVEDLVKEQPPPPPITTLQFGDETTAFNPFTQKRHSGLQFELRRGEHVLVNFAAQRETLCNLWSMIFFGLCFVLFCF